MRNLRSTATTSAVPPKRTTATTSSIPRKKKAKASSKDPLPTTTHDARSQTDSEYTDSEDTNDSSIKPDESDEDSDAGDWEDIIENPVGPTKKRRHPSSARDEEKAAMLASLGELDVDNYAESDMDMSTIDKLLSLEKRKTRNRIPPRVQRELKNLQYLYRRSKKLLALIGHCSERTINEYLHEVSVRTKRTWYQTYLKYSIESTQATEMPAKNQSKGFSERNKHLGHTWSKLDGDWKDIYNKAYFYVLGYLACGWDRPPLEPGAVELTEEEIAKYLPIYRQSVNLEKVSAALGKGKFGSDLPKANQNKGIQAIEQLDKELQVVSLRHGVHYSLMACSWNPETKNRKALWNMQASSCDNWIEMADQKWHLLENFVRETTQADVSQRVLKRKAPPPPRDVLKKKLTKVLNGLVEKHIKPPFGRLDCHPKTASPQLSILNRPFSGGVKLAVSRIKNYRMTDEILSTAFESMSTATHEMWLKDIEGGCYDVIKQGDQPAKKAEENK